MNPECCIWSFFLVTLIKLLGCNNNVHKRGGYMNMDFLIFSFMLHYCIAYAYFPSLKTYS